MSNRPPKNFLIMISLDGDLNFLYKELYSGMNGNSIAVINGDRIGWILDPSIPERALQIDFGIINPFRIYRNLTLRGRGQVIPEQIVKFPLAYPGNRQLKYTVSLGNGFHDDPDVVPVETDVGLLQGLDGLALDADFKIVWTDAVPKYQAITLSPSGHLSKSAGGGKATVTWKWNVGANDPKPPFHLTFFNPPFGWPADTDSTNIDPAITLLLPHGAQTAFQITTTSGDGENEIAASGHLTITA